MNILYTASTDDHLRRFHGPCLSALVSRGHTVTAAAAGDGKGLPAGVRFLPLPFVKRMTAPANLLCAAAVEREIRRNAYDLAVTNTSLAAFFTRLGVAAAGKGHTRVVNIVHGYLFDGDGPLCRRKLLLAAERAVAGVTDDILTMNGTDELTARRCRLCRGEVRRIPGMGLDPGRFSPPTPRERREARSVLGLNEDDVVLLYAAEFSARKNQRAVLEALPLLDDRLRLLLPGTGKELPACRKLAERLGLGDRALFPGCTDDIRPMLRAADICGSSSRSEGLPFHVMEAMASGLPCVLTDIKGHRDLMAGTGAGILCPPGSSGQMAAAVERLASSPGLREAMGRAGQEAVGRFSLERALPILLEALENAGH